MKENNLRNDRFRGGNSRVIAGLIIFFAGLMLLGYKMGLPLPSWLFTWPMILILVGLGIGIKDKFQNPGSWILLLIGFIFLADQNVIGFDFHRFILPLILIIVGLAWILRPRKRNPFLDRQWQPHPTSEPSNIETANNINQIGSVSSDQDQEYVNITSVFGGIKKFIISKNFQGGSIITFMGGAELNLLQSDIQHPIIIDTSNLFGGTKLIIPTNWNLKNEVVAIFGGVEDKRNLQSISPDPGKTVLLKGVCMFGGIELANY